MRQYAPKIEIIHYGVVSGTWEHIDLAKWLGEGCSVSTSKSIRSPMGQFTITFVDKEYPGFDDSVYYMVAPMDAIEIRVAHDGRKAPKLIMRGFVSDVRRDEAMGQDGKPIRRVTIIGHDIGKIFVQQRVYFTPLPEDVGMLLTGMGVLVKYLGPNAKSVTVQQYVSAMNALAQKHLNTLLAESALSINLSNRATAIGLIPPQILNSLNDCSLHDHMARLLDIGIFNEMFTQDTEAGAVLIVRPVFDQEDGISITEQDVQSVSLHRTDADVVNWFWVRLTRCEWWDQMTTLIQATETRAFDQRQFEPCHEKKYGFRKLEVPAYLFPPGHGLEDAPPLPKVHANQASLYNWITERQAQLTATNCYNALYEFGQMRIEGNEDVQIGTWLTLTKGSTTQRMYVIQVNHDFQAFGNYTTTLKFERGDSYFQRMKGGGYKPELNLKGALK
jgi:hypothetical protein